MADTSYVVKVENGYAKLFKPDGSFIRHLCGNAVSAQLKGSDVHVTIKDKTIRVFSVKEFYKKTIENG